MDCEMQTLAHIFSKVLVTLFFTGMVGSLFVVIATVVGDLQEIFTTDEDTDSPEL
jgi:hypothetical protein